MERQEQKSAIALANLVLKGNRGAAKPEDDFSDGDDSQHDESEVSEAENDSVPEPIVSRKGQNEERPVEKPDSQEELDRLHAVGALLKNKRCRMDMLDGAFNRYAFDDDEEALPSWFVEDEAINNRPLLPVTKEVEREYRRKLKEIRNRPIRKAVEAVGRKKLRLKKKLEKVQKQAEIIADSTDRTERSKTEAIRKLKGKAFRSEKRNVSYICSKRGGGGKAQGKIKGNSKVKIVDKRLKSDKRGQKAAARRKKRSR